MVASMKLLGYKITYISAFMKKKFRFVGYIFIDNTNLVGGKLYYSNNNINKVASKIQLAIDTWEGLLKLTG